MKPPFFSGLRATLALGACLLASAGAADWREWRGPRRDDHSPDTGLLKQWPAGGPKRVWLNEDAGLGYSGFSIADGRVFTMGVRDAEEFLIALDAKTGKELWATPVGPRYGNDWGDGPRSTPTVNGPRVYALGGRGTLTCANAEDGKVQWKTSLAEDLGGQLQHWGYTESVLVVGDLVICTPGGSNGTMAAMNKETGKVAWRTTELTDPAQYASPILVEHGDKPQVVQLVTARVFGVDPASGKVLWQNNWPGKTAVIPTPVYHEGHVYVTSGYSVGCMLLKLGTDHSVTTVYQNKVMQNHHGGVVLVDNHIYGYSDSSWTCQNFQTGESVWTSKALGKGPVHFADGMLFCLDETSGEVALVDASPKGWNERSRFKLEPQTKNRKPKGRIWTHPVVVDGRLYLRDQELLSCFDVKG